MVFEGAFITFMHTCIKVCFVFFQLLELIALSAFLRVVVFHLIASVFFKVSLLCRASITGTKN